MRLFFCKQIGTHGGDRIPVPGIQNQPDFLVVDPVGKCVAIAHYDSVGSGGYHLPVSHDSFAAWFQNLENPFESRSPRLKHNPSVGIHGQQRHPVVALRSPIHSHGSLSFPTWSRSHPRCIWLDFQALDRSPCGTGAWPSHPVHRGNTPLSRIWLPPPRFPPCFACRSTGRVWCEPIPPSFRNPRAWESPAFFPDPTTAGNCRKDSAHNRSPFVRSRFD